MSIYGWVCDLAPTASPADRAEASANLMELLTALTYTLRARSGRPLIWDQDRDDDVAEAMLKIYQRAADGRGLGSGTSDGELINFIKVMLTNQANDRGRAAMRRGPEDSIDDSESGVDPEQREPAEPLMDGLPDHLRKLVQIALQQPDPERHMTEEVLGPAVAAASASRRSDHRAAFDRSWEEILALNFDGADPLEILRTGSKHNLATKSGLRAARDARAQRHRSCRCSIEKAAGKLHERGDWGQEHLDLALALIESLKNPQSK